MITLLVAALATWQIVEIYHHSLLFSSVRARIEARGDFLAALTGCPFCLSVWVAMVTTIMMQTDWIWLQTPVLGFAAGRVANLGNDLFHHYSRTPKTVNDLPEDLQT